MVKHKTINRYFYIYLRETSETFDNEEVYKLGCTTNIYNRNETYKTNEIDVKKFITIIRFTPININNIIKECKNIELKYKQHCDIYNIINNTDETEFYYNDIKDLISSFTKRNKEFIKYNTVIITDENDINQEIFNNRINPEFEENNSFNKMFNSKINYINRFKRLKPKTTFVNVNKRIKEIYEHKYVEENTDEKNTDENPIINLKINNKLSESKKENNLENKKDLSNDTKTNKPKIIKNQSSETNSEKNQELNQDNNQSKSEEIDSERQEYRLILSKKYEEYLMLPNNNNPISLKMYIDYYRTHHNHPPIFETIDEDTLKKQEYHQGIYKDLSGFQIETLDKMINHYKNNDKGYLNICCRMGKTRLSLCFIRYMKFNNVIVFVPAKVLLDQWKNSIKQILPSYKVIKFNPSNKKINKQQDNTIYISHYINSYQFINNSYDLKIFDELHHLTCIDLDKQEEKFRKQYINCLKVKSKYQLGLTATLKIINNQSEKKQVISNDDKQYFGELIDKRTFNEGVKYKRLCPLFVHLTEHRTDYNKLNVNERKETNIKKGIKSILKLMFEDKVIYKNIFFVNSISSIINICIPYVEKQIQKHNYNLNIFKYHTSLRIKNDNKTILIKSSTDKQILTDFETCKNGILFAVYGLSEGFDMPFLDSVCIGEKMTTNIRIAQSILRPTTYNVKNPNKISHIILPCTFDKKNNIDTIKNMDKK